MPTETGLNDQPPLEEVTELFSWIIRMTSQNRFDDIDVVLKNTGLETTNTVILLALVRGTSSIRIKLNEWHGFYIKVSEELDRRGLDTGHLLRGLL